MKQLSKSKVTVRLRKAENRNERTFISRVILCLFQVRERLSVFGNILIEV